MKVVAKTLIPASISNTNRDFRVSQLFPSADYRFSNTAFYPIPNLILTSTCCSFPLQH